MGGCASKVEISMAKDKMNRRTWMEWIGKGVVASLGSSLLTKCAVESLAGKSDASMEGFPSEDAGGLAGTESGFDNSTLGSCQDTLTADTSFASVPNKGGLFDSWPVRTVDLQDLQWIVENWRLVIDGMVDTPLSFSFRDLLMSKRQNQISDFHCVEGWSILDVPWNGVHIGTLLSQAGPKAEATHITFHTIGEAYNESLPLDVALESETLLAFGIDCNTLPVEHGFPLRLVVPRLLAYKSAKYVQRLELTDRPTVGYWVARGYSYDGEVPESRLR